MELASKHAPLFDTAAMAGSSGSASIGHRAITLTMDDPFERFPQEPFELFQEWFTKAKESEPNDPNAAALATATRQGVPSVRMVLVKKVSPQGLTFFTNRESQKGSELERNPVAALCFHWKSLRKQVRFAGPTTVLARDAVATYFHSRSRASQIAAAVSAQSRPLGARQELEAKTKAYAADLADADVPLPEFWGGYLLTPHTVEFWADGPDRLHDRLQFSGHDAVWTTRRLYP